MSYRVLLLSTLLVVLAGVYVYSSTGNTASCYIPEEQVKAIAERAMDAGVPYKYVDKFLKAVRKACEREDIKEEVLDLFRRFSSVNISGPVFNQLIDSLESDVHYRGKPELFETYAPPGVSVPTVYLTHQGFNVHHINALNVATAALNYRNDWDGFLRILDGMLRYLEEDDGVAFFKFYFAWETTKIPWVSSISQGIGAGYYAIAYAKTGNSTYLKVAKELVNSFSVPQEKGGFRVELPEGVFYLEYSNAPDDHVLNGFMLSLKGLSLYTKLVKDPEGERYLRDGIETLLKILPKYDCGGWSLYSPKHGKATERYHRLHIRLLYYLGKAEGVPQLVEYSKRWDSYLTNSGAKSELPRARSETEFWLSLVRSLKS